MTIRQHCLWVLVALGSAALRPAAGSDGLIDSAALQRAGFERLWSAHAEVTLGGGELKAVYLHVNDSRATAYFEIYVGGELVKRIATLDTDASGAALGYEGAQSKAELYREVLERQAVASLLDPSTPRAEFNDVVYGTTPEAVARRSETLQAAEKRVEVRKYVEPEMALYALTHANVVQCFDAESGSLRWSQQVGPRNAATVGLTANDAMVAVVVGSRLYCLENEEGRILWSRTCSGVPTAPPAMSATHIFVPEIGGILETYEIALDGVGSERYVSHGMIFARPFVTGRTVSWPTDRGHYNIASYDRIGTVKARVRTNGPIFAPPGKLGRVLFVPSLDGYVYAVDELTGSVYWEYSTGTPLTQQPLAVNNGLYVVTENEKLIKIDARSGAADATWPASVPGIRQLVGANGQWVYAISSTGQLVGLRQDSGRQDFAVDVDAGVKFLNFKTDRIFLASEQGILQCLRHQADMHPWFIIPVSESISGEPKAEADAPRTKSAAARVPSEGANPFDAAADLAQDPFTATEPVRDNPFITPSQGKVNPFETPSESPSQPPAAPDAADPFGMPEQKKDAPSEGADPFGGG